MKIIVIVLSGPRLRRCLVGAAGGKSPPGARPWHRPSWIRPATREMGGARPNNPPATPPAPHGRRPSRPHARANFEIYVKNKARPSGARAAVGRVAFSLGRRGIRNIHKFLYLRIISQAGGRDDERRRIDRGPYSRPGGGGGRETGGGRERGGRRVERARRRGEAGGKEEGREGGGAP